MKTPMNVEKCGIARRSMNDCRRERGWVLRIGVVSASVLLWATAGQAQVAVSPFGVGVYGGGWGGVGTVESSAEHGFADIVRSEGIYNRMTAEGLVHVEKARAIYLENKKAAYQAYNAGREQNAARVAQKRERERPSAEALRAAAKSDMAAPLGADMLHPETGKISWPKALLDNKFSSQRRELDRLFELRARTSAGLDCQSQIEIATHEMADLLKTNIAKIPTSDYMKARKFLDSMAATVSQSRATT